MLLPKLLMEGYGKNSTSLIHLQSGSKFAAESKGQLCPFLLGKTLFKVSCLRSAVEKSLSNREHLLQGGTNNQLSFKKNKLFIFKTGKLEKRSHGIYMKLKHSFYGLIISLPGISFLPLTHTHTNVYISFNGLKIKTLNSLVVS